MVLGSDCADERSWCEARQLTGCNVLPLGSVLLDVFLASVAEDQGSGRALRLRPFLLEDLVDLRTVNRVCQEQMSYFVHGRPGVLESVGDGTGRHDLKAHCQSALGDAVFDKLAGVEESGGASRAGVCDVRDRDASHAELCSRVRWRLRVDGRLTVQSSLARAAVSP
jgi:hypothetical protein